MIALADIKVSDPYACDMEELMAACIDGLTAIGQRQFGEDVNSAIDDGGLVEELKSAHSAAHGAMNAFELVNRPDMAEIAHRVAGYLWAWIEREIATTADDDEIASAEVAK